MKSAYYPCSNRETGEAVHHIVVYDETQPCLLCGLPVNEASMGGTAICGACDCGKLRAGGRRIHYPYGTKLDVWQNTKEGFYYPTREEADMKMYDLHRQGIIGWPFIVERVERRLSQQRDL